MTPCFLLFVCLFPICWEAGDGLSVGLLVIVLDKLICLLPRVAGLPGLPLPGLLLVVTAALVVSSKSTAMMSFTELMIDVLLGWLLLSY